MSLDPMHFGQARVRLVQAGAALAAAALVAGCGSNYRAPVTPINPSGPPSQPQSLVAVVSAPSPNTPGIATIIDYAGDSVMATAPIGPGPRTFTMDEGGANGYTINSDGTLTNFPVSTSRRRRTSNTARCRRPPILSISIPRQPACGSQTSMATTSITLPDFLKPFTWRFRWIRLR